MKARLRRNRPSPAMIVAGTALVIALAGTAMAAPVAVMSVLDKSEKKSVKKIAANQVKALAPGLSVANAANAANATNATNATTANSATSANALGGVPLNELVPTAEANDTACEPVAAFATDCVGVTITVTRTSDIQVSASGTWHSDDAAGANVEGNCRIERNDVALSATNTYGTENDDTVVNQYERALVVGEIDENRPPGTYLYELSCSEIEGDFDVLDITTQAVGLGS